MEKILKTVDWPIKVPVKAKDYRNELVYSSDFSLKFNDVISTWCLGYNLNYKNRNVMDVFLKRIYGKPAVQHDFDIEFTTSIENTKLSVSLEHPKTQFSTQFPSWGHKLAESSEVEAARKSICKDDEDGTLLLRCVITAINVKENEQVKSSKPIFTPTSIDRSNNIFQLLVVSSPDVTLNTADGMSFKAHKSVLGEKSEVFQKMFSNGLEESETKTVDVIEFKGPVMQELLRFIYFGNVENISEIDVELYKAADVYNIADLRPICLQSINSGISNENVVKVAEFADQHDLNDLFIKCCDKTSSLYFDRQMKSSLKKLNRNLREKILDTIVVIKLANDHHVVVEAEGRIAATDE